MGVRLVWPTGRIREWVSSLARLTNIVHLQSSRASSTLTARPCTRERHFSQSSEPSGLANVQLVASVDVNVWVLVSRDVLPLIWSFGSQTRSAYVAALAFVVASDVSFTSSI